MCIRDRSNTGSMISAEHIRNIFDRFYKIDMAESSTPGSTPAKPTMELRRGKRRTSPISAISCAAVVSPTPYMAFFAGQICLSARAEEVRFYLMPHFIPPHPAYRRANGIFLLSYLFFTYYL